MGIMLVDGQSIPVDKEGYLQDLTHWSASVAETIARSEGIQLTEGHWEIIELLQQFHSEFEHSPAMRILVKYVKQKLGEDKGNSIYLMHLFPGSPAKLAAKVAGLPRPTNCL
ncbi:TusE/DsrC/DsvC family sulfur relay protein [Ketobacter sp.]|uniref:TusE/DsrC/DsvC family sulfur relay protein n=1 Tax=Ketobacter sp. TaxID=2083498 RepID=UPI000F274786|nr:TusE/DsrC/DsvC family sulfur relay protein [Ketobacter sp.]RLT97380.1 MAG: TusE/DsrC/DsvC family sulfur relay protein [Ketobacter sp.]